MMDGSRQNDGGMWIQTASILDVFYFVLDPVVV